MKIRQGEGLPNKTTGSAKLPTDLVPIIAVLPVDQQRDLDITRHQVLPFMPRGLFRFNEFGHKQIKLPFAGKTFFGLMECVNCYHFHSM